jgi:hypothetical protein
MRDRQFIDRAQSKPRLLLRHLFNQIECAKNNIVGERHEFTTGMFIARASSGSHRSWNLTTTAETMRDSPASELLELPEPESI